MAYQRYYQNDIYEMIFQDPLRKDHELILLADRIDWEEIEERLFAYYSRRGRRAKKIRLMVGLHILKHRFNLSDEAVVQGLHENVYWMKFCGVKLNPRYELDEEGKERPLACEFLEASSLSKFRRRIGKQGMQMLEEIIREQLILEKRIFSRSQLIDTTAMEKDISYPTDTGLLNRGRLNMLKTIQKIKEQGVEIKSGLRSFARLGKKIIIEVNKLSQGRSERIEQGAKKLIKYARHLVERVPQILENCQQKIRKLKNKSQKIKILKQLKERLAEQTKLVEKVIHQTTESFKGNHVKDKIYSLHEPEVACIRKGKRKKPNEYGCKVLLSIDRNGYIVAHQEYPANPSDSELLEEGLKQWEDVFGQPAKELGTDRGFHRNEENSCPHLRKVERVSIPTKGKKPHKDRETAWFKRLQRLRTKIEPIISHLKGDHRMDRSRYKGFEGDQINVSLTAIAWNLKKWGRHLVAASG